MVSGWIAKKNASGSPCEPLCGALRIRAKYREGKAELHERYLGEIIHRRTELGFGVLMIAAFKDRVSISASLFRE